MPNLKCAVAKNKSFLLHDELRFNFGEGAIEPKVLLTKYFGIYVSVFITHLKVMLKLKRISKTEYEFKSYK
jgi:hypothetical protein